MKQLCKNKYWKINEEYDINKILYLLIDRPNHINMYNNLTWWDKRALYHRDYDLPVFIYKNGYVCWWKNNKCHRENNKPAIIRCNGETFNCVANIIIKYE